MYFRALRLESVFLILKRQSDSAILLLSVQRQRNSSILTNDMTNSMVSKKRVDAHNA